MDASKLLMSLADGRFHSGSDLAKAHGVTRTAVWKQVQVIEQRWGVKIFAVRGKGYRLAEPLELLDEATIRQSFSLETQRRLCSLEIHRIIDSTNRHLMQCPSPVEGVQACLAERQTEGQGRRGRHWYSPFARNIYLSLRWRSVRPPHQLAGLGLALGVAAAEVLRQLGFDRVGLKWPNDLVTAEGKLGGMLIQMTGEGEGPSTLVAGIGINVRMPSETGNAIDQPWIDLARLGDPPSRSLLAGRLINAWILGLTQYETHGLEPFLARWRHLDQYLDQDVALIRGEERIHGVAQGIAEDGSLLLRTDQGLIRFHAGEISLRGR